VSCIYHSQPDVRLHDLVFLVLTTNKRKTHIYAKKKKKKKNFA